MTNTNKYFLFFINIFFFSFLFLHALQCIMVISVTLEDELHSQFYDLCLGLANKIDNLSACMPKWRFFG